jgi:hypothetical protein
MPTSNNIGQSSGFNIRDELEYTRSSTEAAIVSSKTLIAASRESWASTQRMIAATYDAIERSNHAVRDSRFPFAWNAPE